MTQTEATQGSAPSTSAGDSARTLVIQRKFNAPMQRVFDAWTDPEQVVRWWGPRDMHVPESSFDVKVGGKWRTTMQNTDGGTHTCSGEYRQLDGPSRIAFTWAWETDGKRGHETLVSIELSETDGGTLMHFEQQRFESEETRDSHNDGWSSSFGCLEDALV